MKRKYIAPLIIICACTVTIQLPAQTAYSLEDYKKMAVENNHNIKNSRLEIDAAKQTQKSAFTNYFPSVSANAFGMSAIDPLFNYKMEGGNLPVYDGNPANLPTATQFAYFPGVDVSLLQKAAVGIVNITQPLYAGGRIITGNKLAGLNTEVKESQYRLTENEILFKTEQQYWQLLSLQEKQKTLDKYEELLKDVRKQVDDAYNAGLVIKNDVLKVQIKQSELEMNKSKLENGKKLALMQFCNTVGIAFDSTLVLQETIDISKDPNRYYVDNKEALPNRTEYRLLEKSVEAAQLQIKMKRGDYLPTVAVGVAGYYYHPLTKGANDDFNGLIYATVSIPISDWWGGSHSIKEQKIKQKIAKNTFEDTKELLNLQMEKARTDMNEAYKQISILQETILQAEENLKVSQTGYENGIVTLSDLLEAQALAVETEGNLIEAQTQYKLAVTNYLQVTGR